MSTLTGSEEVCLEVVFCMANGMVLEFSDESFGRFFECYGVDIHGSRYQFNGTSDLPSKNWSR